MQNNIGTSMQKSFKAWNQGCGNSFHLALCSVFGMQTATKKLRLSTIKKDVQKRTVSRLISYENLDDDSQQQARICMQPKVCSANSVLRVRSHKTTEDLRSRCGKCSAQRMLVLIVPSALTQILPLGSAIFVLHIICSMVQWEIIFERKLFPVTTWGIAQLTTRYQSHKCWLC